MTQSLVKSESEPNVAPETVSRQIQTSEFTDMGSLTTNSSSSSSSKPAVSPFIADANSPFGVVSTPLTGITSDKRPGSTQTIETEPTNSRSRFALLSSVRLLFPLLATLGTIILLGAWCPQEATVGQEKVIEQFGPEMAVTMHQWGISDIFHTPFFMFVIAALSVNLVFASVQKVFPRLKLLKVAMPWLKSKSIAKLAYHTECAGNVETIDTIESKLRRMGYRVWRQDTQIQAHFGKFGRLAPSVTHVGLLLLLIGVTITSWTGFNGFKPVRLGSDLSFEGSQHSQMWIGKLPKWKVRVDGTRREDYPTGEAKQWYSDLTAIDENGKVLSKQQISVNTPFTYDNVDIYQSSWGMDQILVRFNDKEQALDLRPMGKIYASFLPLDKSTILIFSVKDQTAPLRLFAKRMEWQGAPKFITEITPGHSVNLGSVQLTYEKSLPVTGLQYKSDPGLWVTYTAFGMIMLGVVLMAVPFRQAWFSLEDGKIYAGGKSPKSRVGFARQMNKLISQVRVDKDNNETPLDPEFSV